MKTLYLRIWLTVVAALLLFALVSGWIVQRNIEHERERFETAASERQNDRLNAWAELLQNALPPATAPAEEQARELLEWSDRLRLPMALDDASGRRIATSPMYARLTGEAPDPGPEPGLQIGRDGADDARPPRPPSAEPGFGPPRPPPGEPGFGPPRGEKRVPQSVRFADGRSLSIVRGGPPRGRFGGGPEGGPRMVPAAPPFVRGIGLVLTVGVLFIAVAAGAYPVVRRLTRRLEALKQGVEDFGAGELTRRVDASGRDEVAAVAASFNAAAERVQALVASHRSLLANASHELRSPLARLKMALAMTDNATAEQAAKLKREIELNIAELDALVEEVLLASRLDAQGQAPGAAAPVREPVDLLSLVVEEVARFDADLAPSDPAFALDGARSPLRGDERLLRRALRNLLENARRYAGSEPAAVALRRVATADGARAEIRVCDRGPGVPEAQRERIFEPFYRLPGHAEQAGGVGLGLSLVRQIARHHGGEVRCEARDGGGSCFVLALPIESSPATA